LENSKKDPVKRIAYKKMKARGGREYRKRKAERKLQERQDKMHNMD